MLIVKRVMAGGLLLLGFSLPAFAGSAQEAGLWRFDVRYEIVSIPQTFPSYQKTQCLTADNPIPDVSRPGQECTGSPRGRFGNIQTWQVDCSDEWESSQGVGRIVYEKDNAKGELYIQILNPHNPPEFMIFHIEGVRLGACKR